jgi:hypothetical protein
MVIKGPPRRPDCPLSGLSHAFRLMGWITTMSIVMGEAAGLSGCATALNQPPLAATNPTSSLQTAIREELEKPYAEFNFVNDSSPDVHAKPFFEDAYAVIALAKLGGAENIRVSKIWADRMLDYQAKMIPARAYYMNYYRKPSQRDGTWLTADASTIGLAILNVYEATGDSRYLDSVNQYVSLVEARFINSDLGVNDGFWGSYTDSWWCSTANYGSLVLELYRVTRYPKYLTRTIELLRWLDKEGLNGFIYPDINTSGPTIVFYVGLFVGAAEEIGIPQTKLGSDLREWLTQHPTANADVFQRFPYVSGFPVIADRLEADSLASEQIRVSDEFVLLEFDKNSDVNWCHAVWNLYGHAELAAEGTDDLNGGQPSVTTRSKR